MNSFDEVQSLLQDKADIQARIKLIPYDGNTEIKQIASLPAINPVFFKGLRRM